MTYRVSMKIIVMPMNMNMPSLITWLRDDGPLSPQQQELFQRACDALAQLATDDIEQLLSTMIESVAGVRDARLARWDLVLRQLVRRQRQGAAPPTAPVRERISLLYNKLEPHSPCRTRLLQWLAMAAGPHDLELLVELVIANPPRDAQAAAMILAPLFQRTDYDPAALFPRLLEALQHVHLAAPVLDLCNYLTHQGRVDRHPCRPRLDELITLLGSVVQRLSEFEGSPSDAVEHPDVIRRQVDEGVALVVALCGAVGLIGDRRAVGKLYQAMELAHRRIRVESAAALARLGEPAGEEALVALAAEPVVRLRVLETAEELGLSERVAPQYASDVARAEAGAAFALAQPTFFGMPPAELQLVDHRTQFWPGYEQPVVCHLFRYTYRFAAGRYSNVAIAGPFVHAFAADLSDLPPEDIYAAYAGWQVEHDSVYEIPVDALSAAQRIEQDRFERRLRGAGYEEVRGALLGHFFGDRALVAHAVRGGVAGVVVVDAQGIEWYPNRTQRHPLGPFEAFCIYKGRRLLKAFNR